MANISLPGILTGIDTQKLIEQLMAVNRRRLNMLESRQSNWNEKQDALNTLESKLDAFRTTVKVLDDADELRAFGVSSSDTDKITAEATSTAFEGNHNVVINQLATAERWVHSGLEYAEDLVGEGTFIYSYNHQETTITTTATTTLNDLVGLINNDADNPGVTAGLLSYDGAYHLVLNGQDAGSDYQIAVNDSNTEVRQADSAFTADSDNATLNTKLIDLDQFSGTLGDSDSAYITISGKDHNGNDVTGQVNVTSNTKLFHLIEEINDTFGGNATATLENGKIRLSDHTCGASQMELTLSYNPGSGSTDLTLPTISQLTQGGSQTADLTGFASTDFTETQSAQDSKIKVDGYPTTTAVAEVQKLSTTSAATAGAFTLTYDGHTTAAINYDATTADIQSALEALPNVSAGDIVVSGDNLIVAGGETIFTFADTAGDVSLISINPAGLTPSDSSNYVMTEETAGSDGWINRSSNTVDDVISGLTLHLHDTTDAGGEEVNLTRDVESVKEKLEKMVETYNAAVTFIQEKTGYNEELKTGGVLMGDYVVSQIRQQFRNPLVAWASGFREDVDSFLMPGDIGLELDSDGMLSLDSDVFDEAIGEDYRDVLALIGAAKTGSSESNDIKFYGASQRYTTAGIYDVQVTVSGGAITSAQIKLSTESAYRDMTIDGNIITGNSTFDDNGDAVYAENGLQLSVDLSTDGDYTARVRVRQGFAGALEDELYNILRATKGSLQIDESHISDIIEDLQEKIENEQERLTKVETRLVQKFARMEKQLALLQQQVGAAGMLG